MIQRAVIVHHLTSPGRKAGGRRDDQRAQRTCALACRRGDRCEFGFLQLRPLALSTESEEVEIGDVPDDALICRSGQVLGPEERIPVMEALATYTTHAAWCSFEEGVKGAITAGMLADFTVLSENPLTVDPLKIKDIEVIATTVGGRLAYGSL